jgi:hypothetical protein
MSTRKIKAIVNEEPILIQLTGFRGGHFISHFARRDPGYGPGWYVFGRNPAYGSTYTMLTGQPDVMPRKHPHYNCYIQRGWKTKSEAEAIAAVMNQRDADCMGAITSLGALHGTIFRESTTKKEA